MANFWIRRRIHDSPDRFRILCRQMTVLLFHSRLSFIAKVLKYNLTRLMYLHVGASILCRGIALSILAFLLLEIRPASAIAPERSLEQVDIDLMGSQLSVDQRLFSQRTDLLRSIDQTRAFLKTAAGRTKLASFEKRGIHVDMMERSLETFARLLASSRSQQELVRRIQSSFDLYRSTGSDGRGKVRFTGYFRPLYEASQVKTPEFSFPLFKRPTDFERWAQPHPTRVMLEGYDGKGGGQTILRGNELAWVRSRFEAYMIHVQGSAVLEFPDGSRRAIGFAAGTSYPFRGISREFLRKHNISWTRLEDFFRSKPALMDQMVSNNNRFIFFAEQDSSEPIGSLGLPVIEERSIAVDQGHLPPGAIGIIRTNLPARDPMGRLKMVPTSRFVLNLDSGSAIRGPGRVDVFMGTGEEARERASSVNNPGQLYYLFDKSQSS